MKTMKPSEALTRAIAQRLIDSGNAYKVKGGSSPSGPQKKKRRKGGYQGPENSSDGGIFPDEGSQAGAAPNRYGAVGRAIQAGARSPWETTRVGPTIGPPVAMPRYRRGKTRRA